ncbi:hypothetical protein [Stenotrophomonas nitritireducens]|uniref:hypothetical protein n=1 Tax=Stenotrophomonas nitritireducens TaxID=83617 RepID=UPI003D98F631
MGDIVGKGRIAGLLVVAGLAMWLLLAGPARVLGLDGGNIGVLLLMGTMWAALHGIGRATREDLESAGSPGEWKAWLGLGFMSLAVVYALARAPVFLHMTRWNDPDAAAVARNLVLLLVAWTVLSRVVDSRWKEAVRGDERDRGIEHAAAGWGRGALVAGVIGVAVTLGLSPAEKLQWARPFVVANLLVFVLMGSWLVEYAATAIQYWRDRHGARA